MVDAVKPFLHPQLFAMRTASVIQPAFWIQPGRLDYERVVIHPFSDGVAIPPRLRVLGQLSPIGPDDAIIAVKWTQDNHLLGSLNEVDGPEFPKLHVREPERITLVRWIIRKHGRNLPDTRSRWPIGLERFQTQRRVM